MNQKLLSLLLALCLLAGLLPTAALRADAAQALPTEMILEPSEANGLPAAIRLIRTETDALYLPGNVDPAVCRFSWEGGLTASDGERTWESGTLPIPAPGQTRTYTFRAGSKTAAFTVTTWQGSAAVKPVFVEIDESLGTIEAMNSDPAHNTECHGMIYIDGEAHTLSKMKGRGNIAWRQSTDKRAYNVTLGKKAVILGLDVQKTKKYSFLANMGDHSLLRDKMGYDLGYELGVGNDSANADVWMNGVYQGVYLVTPKTDSYVTDDGYLLENDNGTEPPISEGGDPSFNLRGLSGSNGTDTVNNGDNRITVKEIGDNLLLDENGKVDKSEENLLAVTEEIRAWTQDAWDAIRSPSGYNEKGRYYTDYIDITSFAKMFLVLEYSKDYDVCCGSKFLQRFGTADTDKLYAMPVWDLDNAFGSVCENGALLLNADISMSTGYGGYFHNMRDVCTSIYKTLGKHRDFMEEVCRVYAQYKPAFDAIPQKLDAFAAELADSARMNFHKVDPLDKSSIARYTRDTVKNAGTKYEQTYYATTDSRNDWPIYVRNLRTFCAARTMFLDEYMANGYYAEPIQDEQPFPFRFEDVQNPNKYYYTPIYWAVTRIPQITAGTTFTTFSPNRVCTRGQAMTFLYHAARNPELHSTDTPFADVKPGAYYYSKVLWAVENGITSGVSSNRFGPRQQCTRAQIITFLYSLAGKPPVHQQTLPFTDVKPSAYYRKAVAWAVENGITAGRSATRFAPNEACTRGEVMTFLYKMLKDV